MLHLIFHSYSFICSMILQIHNMNTQNLTLEQVQSLFNIIQALQAEVADLKISHTLIFNSSQENMIFIIIVKSVKLSDSLMFRNNQKKLCSFVMKLCLKLQENADQYSTE